MFFLLLASGFLTAWIVFFRAIGPFLYEFYLFHIAPRLGRELKPVERFGLWAIITGASDGLGKGYAFALAGKGMNLLLVARNEAKLNRVREEVLKTHPNVKIDILVYDFSKEPLSSDVEMFKNECSKYENDGGIGILINNVGVSSKTLLSFQKSFLLEDESSAKEGSIESVSNSIRVNCLSEYLMIMAILPFMLKRNNGAIVNITSVSAIQPFGGYCVYGSTKSFVHFFSRALRQDLKVSNIFIQTVAPGCVKTAMLPLGLHFSGAIGNFFVPDYRTWTASAVETIGRMQETNGCLGHRIVGWLLTLTRLAPIKLADFAVQKWHQNSVPKLLKTDAHSLLEAQRESASLAAQAALKDKTI